MAQWEQTDTGGWRLETALGVYNHVWRGESCEWLSRIAGERIASCHGSLTAAQVSVEARMRAAVYALYVSLGGV